jgi:ATP/maltotriose-dependent transcriptional regulator MalT
MIAGDSRAARTYGARALALARTLGLRAIEADVLITLGPTRVGDGDLGGVEDVAAGVELAEALNTPTVSRGYANLSYVYGLLGELRLNHEWRQRTREAAERFGVTELQRWSRAHDTEHWWFVGDWDRALANSEAFIAELEPSAYYLVAVCLRVRAQVRMGRGNQIGALADAAAAAEFARGASHPSNLLVALPFYARCLLEAGRPADADAAITETVTATAGLENAVDPIQTAFVMWRLGRATEFLDLASRTTLESRRWDIGRTLATGDLERAADLLAEAGHRSYEAGIRLAAAEHLHGQGRQPEAQTQARLALAFHRSVGATAYVRRGQLIAP